jgi:1,4-dihydroxy-6-naphthoate synthase
VLVVGHSPDPDDAFMYYGIASGAVRVEGFDEVREIVADIESLNHLVVRGDCLDATAASFHATLYAASRYYVLRTGASMGLGYGPVVVARSRRELRGARIAVPGRWTTAYLLLRLALGDEFTPVFMRFDEIPSAVERGVVDAGLLIHEEQIAYEQRGLVKVLDLWEWWESRVGRRPLPLGVDIVAKRLGIGAARAFARALRESIDYAYAHEEEALEYAMRYSRIGDRELVRRFIRMYVNEYTRDMGGEGVEAHRLLAEMAVEAGLAPRDALDNLEFV